MADQKYTIKDHKNKEILVWVRRDNRLKKTSRWQREADGSILVRIPDRLPKRQIGNVLEQIRGKLDQQVKLASRRTDADLQTRAEHINKTYFDGKIEWRAIRWVGNMNSRLGSCSSGGSTDGHIRISDKIKTWPQWVIDYVIAHEMVHRIHRNHGKAFWATLSDGYPLTERARGFIRGIGFAEGQNFEDD